MSSRAVEEIGSNPSASSDAKATAIALELADSVHFLFDALSALPQAALILSKSGKVKYLNDNMRPAARQRAKGMFGNALRFFFIGRFFTGIGSSAA